MPSQSSFSTNWKPGSALSKPVQMNSETTKVTSVVHSAIARMLRRALALSSRMNRISSAPTSGRKVTVGEDGPVGHQNVLPNIIQVTSAATPISMAKA